jgi:hypothetical protein
METNALKRIFDELFVEGNDKSDAPRWDQELTLPKA